jgi:hypothetical protein
MYYEWYIAVDETHYMYMQISCVWPKNILDKLWFLLKYYLYGEPFCMGRFNDQDSAVVKDSTDFAIRHGGSAQTMRNPPTPRVYRPDVFHTEWIKLCNQTARGEVSEAAATTAAPAQSTSGAQG